MTYGSALLLPSALSQSRCLIIDPSAWIKLSIQYSNLMFCWFESISKRSSHYIVYIQLWLMNLVVVIGTGCIPPVKKRGLALSSS
ncbi:MAG: hypothetical protein A4E47_00988 [Methanosaeta sp. PtaU1.Bin028]|nr:MAG: hypothetical protein A4E47_00988 [Methanosaeta sp. PtaU1.Bin028]